MRTMWMVLSLTLAGPALGGPGFDGVGDRGRIPAFSDEEAALEDEEALLEIVAKHDPEQHERLLRLREVDRPAYLLALSRVAKVVERAKDDPEFRERRLSIQSKTQQVKELAREHRRLPAAEQPAARERIEQLVGELLDLKQQDRRARLDELRARLEQLQAEFDEREGDRQRRIDEHVDELLR
jgi:cysteinyl-tRNA synthetase